MREDGTWGGDVELNALSNLYSVEYTVYTYNPYTLRHEEMTLPAQLNSSGFVENFWRLSYHDRHYEPILTNNPGVEVTYPTPGEIEERRLAVGAVLGSGGTTPIVSRENSIQGQFNAIWASDIMVEESKEDEINVDIKDMKRVSERDYLDQEVVRKAQQDSEQMMIEEQLMRQTQGESLNIGGSLVEEDSQTRQAIELSLALNSSNTNSTSSSEYDEEIRRAMEASMRTEQEERDKQVAEIMQQQLNQGQGVAFPGQEMSEDEQMRLAIQQSLE